MPSPTPVAQFSLAPVGPGATVTAEVDSLVVPCVVVIVVVGKTSLPPLVAPLPSLGHGRSLNELSASRLLEPVTVTTAVAVQPASIVVWGRTVRSTTFLGLCLTVVQKGKEGGVPSFGKGQGHVGGREGREG